MYISDQDFLKILIRSRILHTACTIYDYSIISPISTVSMDLDHV